VIACRVSFEPRVSWEIECGRRPESFATSAKRVLSPRAANTGAGFIPREARRCAARPPPFLRDIVFDVLHLLGPTTLVSAEGVETAIFGKLVEAGLGDYQERARGSLLQPEFDERGWFA